MSLCQVGVESSDGSGCTDMRFNIEGMNIDAILPWYDDMVITLLKPLSALGTYRMISHTSNSC